MTSQPASLFAAGRTVFHPEAVYVEKETLNYPLTGQILRQLPRSRVIEIENTDAILEELHRSSMDVFGAAKKRLLLSRFKGSFLKKCPGISPGMVCCNYYVVNLISNCIFDCSYCVLQDFLENNPLLTVYVNVEDALAELDAAFAARPDSQFRVGTGELSDSLALDDIVPLSGILTPFFNARHNAVLELKTKSACVNNLLRREDTRNVIVSWSLNPRIIADREEKGAAKLEQRLAAAALCQAKGYRIGLHFDPVILFSGWEQAYQELVEETFARIDPKRVEWVSLGGFRYRPNLKRVIKERHRDTWLFHGEHLAGEDGKFRYLRPLRHQAYETLSAYLRRRDPDLRVYFCMETKEIWQDVTGRMPRADKKLDQFFDM